MNCALSFRFIRYFVTSNGTDVLIFISPLFFQLTETSHSLTKYHADFIFYFPFSIFTLKVNNPIQPGDCNSIIPFFSRMQSNVKNQLIIRDPTDESSYSPFLIIIIIIIIILKSLKSIPIPSNVNQHSSLVLFRN